MRQSRKKAPRTFVIYHSLTHLCAGYTKTKKDTIATVKGLCPLDYKMPTSGYHTRKKVKPSDRYKKFIESQQKSPN